MESTLQVPGRKETIKAHKKSGGLIAAVLPIHYPRALLRAFNFLPVELWGPPGIESSEGGKHLQPYVCSIARNALAFLHRGGLDIADAIVTPHTCDSLQGLGSILLDFISPRQPIIPIYLPRGKRQSDIEFLAQEFRVVYRRFREITGKSPSDDKLMECSRREEEADSLLAKVCQRRKEIALSDAEFYRMARSREYLPAEVFCRIVREAQTGKNSGEKTPIVVSGIIIEPVEVLEKIAQKGGMVAADDLACCGRRLYPAGTGDDPFLRMAGRIVNGPPDSTLGAPIEMRLSHLLGLVEHSRAKGVVFYNVKFCEPELFDMPELMKGLKQADIPTLSVEVDLSEHLSHQVVTRLEAFLEMIA